MSMCYRNYLFVYRCRMILDRMFAVVQNLLKVHRPEVVYLLVKFSEF